MNIEQLITLVKRAEDLSLSLNYNKGNYTLSEGGECIYSTPYIEALDAFLKGYMSALVSAGIRDGE